MLRWESQKAISSRTVNESRLFKELLCQCWQRCGRLEGCKRAARERGERVAVQCRHEGRQDLDVGEVERLLPVAEKEDERVQRRVNVARGG